MIYLDFTDILQINQYISLYARSGVLPSKLFQGKAAEVGCPFSSLSMLLCFCHYKFVPLF